MPTEASWAGGLDGGGWVLCSTSSPDYNECQIFDEEGRSFGPRRYVLRGANRPASKKELNYSFVAGDIIGLKGGRELVAIRAPLRVELPEDHRKLIHDCNFAKLHPLRLGSDWLSSRNILRRVQPTYPAEARRRNVSGTVVVRILISSNGQVQQVCGAGPPLLLSAAEEAASEWLFNTPSLNGKKVAYFSSELRFDFVVDGRQKSSGRQ